MAQTIFFSAKNSQEELTALYKTTGSLEERKGADGGEQGGGEAVDEDVDVPLLSRTELVCPK